MLAEPRGTVAANREHIGLTFNNYVDWKKAVRSSNTSDFIDKVGT